MTETEPNNLSDVSLHYVKQKGYCSMESSPPSTVKVVVEENAMPLGQCCINCPECATYSCTQCAPWVYYCDQCFAEAHSKINLFHIRGSGGMVYF